MVISDFIFAGNPRIYFGAGRFNEIDKIINEFGQTVLIVSGSKSLQSSGKLDRLFRLLKKRSFKFFHLTVPDEPSPDLVDNAVIRFKQEKIDMVTAIGGGSVVDAGKAVSAMLTQGGSVVDYLESVGTKSHNGKKIPFIAVPTTAGTGSEATKNAVLSRVGEAGFKKSLRHNNFVPDIALIDPELALSCPLEVSAACGMDAFTQLLESYVSRKASPMTDSLAYSGISWLKDSLISVCTNGADNVAARGAMAYASLMSGITLANAGLGIVHGLASSIGGFFNIPHGIICGTLIGTATRINIRSLKEQGHAGYLSLQKFAGIGKLVSGIDSNDIEDNCNRLIDTVDEWTEKLNLPLLSKYGMNSSEIEKIVQKTGNKENPVQLDNRKITEILAERT